MIRIWDLVFGIWHLVVLFLDLVIGLPAESAIRRRSKEFGIWILDMKESVHHKKIGLVLSSAPGYSETFFRNNIKGLQKYGHEVTLFLDDAPENGQRPPCKCIVNINLHENGFKRGFRILQIIYRSFFVHIGASYRLLRLDRADGLSVRHALKNVFLNEYLLNHSLDWLHFGFGMLTHNRENVAQAINAKMAVSFRGFDLYLSPLKHPGCYKRLFAKQVKYHVLSNEMKKTLFEQNISATHIDVITPAIDVGFFTPEKTKNENEILQIITVARLHWIKGLEYILEALTILKQQNIPFHYKIIGAGEERERLIFAAHQLGILDHIDFIGKLPPKEIRLALNEADIYLQYSIQEGFCNAVVEAQSMGLLCIVSNAEGLSENIMDSKTGWVIPKRQPKLLAQKIEEVLIMPISEKRKIQQNAIARVKTNFNLEAQHQAFMAFYRDSL